MKPRLPLFAAMTVCLGIAACSENPAPPAKTLVLPAESKASAEGAALVAQKWLSLRAACPGLDKFSAALQPAAAEDNFASAPQHAQRATVSYRISGKVVTRTLGTTATRGKAPSGRGQAYLNGWQI